MIAVLMWCLLSQTGAAAEPGEQALAEAKTYFEAGRQAYEATDYLTAAQAFAQAQALAPRAAIVFSMAQAYRQQYFLDRRVEHLQRAIELYGEYVAQTDKGGRKGDAQRFKAELERELKLVSTKASQPPPLEAGEVGKGKTQLMISSRTPGATASLDGGEPQEMPLIAEVEPGPHEVKVEAEGFLSAGVKQTAVEGRLVVAEINLAEKPAAVRVNAPEGAEVSVDGRYVGQAPLLFPIQLRAGSHFLAVTDRGSHAFVRELSLDRGQELSLTASLETTAQRDVSYYFIGGGAVLFAGTLGTAIGALVSEGGARLIRRKIEVDQVNITAEERADYEKLRELRGTLIATSSGLLVGALALGLTGGLLYALDNPGVHSRKPAELEEDAFSIAPVIGDGQFGAMVGGSF